MAERNASVAADERIDFRLGINVGDIIIDGDDIFGDGVNVAARLQALAEPGHICVSKVVRDQVLDKLSFPFEDLGPQEVKNIARPVEAYLLSPGSAALPTLSRSRKRWQRLKRALRRRWLAIGVLALGVAGVAVWTLPTFWKTVLVDVRQDRLLGQRAQVVGMDRVEFDGFRMAEFASASVGRFRRSRWEAPCVDLIFVDRYPLEVDFGIGREFA